jgi:hypothetical protein
MGLIHIFKSTKNETIVTFSKGLAEILLKHKKCKYLISIKGRDIGSTELTTETGESANPAFRVITGRRFLAENPLLASKKKIKINKERKEHD